MGGMGLGKGIRGWCVCGGGASGDRPGGREGGRNRWGQGTEITLGQRTVSPISSGHHLSSMNGFWYHMQEKQGPCPPNWDPQLSPLTLPSIPPGAPQGRGEE